MAVQANRLPFFLAAFGVLLLIATLFHQINGVPESWKARFNGDGGQVSSRSASELNETLYASNV